MKRLVPFLLLLFLFLGCHTFSAERTEMIINGANLQAKEYTTISKSYLEMVNLLLEKNPDNAELKAIMSILFSSGQRVAELHLKLIELIESSPFSMDVIKELVLTGQDTTYFGRDQGNEFLLPELLRRLDDDSGAEWIRLLYGYPSCVTTGLIEVIRDAKHVCLYLDIPL